MQSLGHLLVGQISKSTKSTENNIYVAIVIILLVVTLGACNLAPADDEPLSLADLTHISFGATYPEIAWRLGDGDWLSGAECFSVR